MAFYSPMFLEAGEKHVSRGLLDTIKQGVLTFTAHNFQYVQDSIAFAIYVSD